MGADFRDPEKDFYQEENGTTQTSSTLSSSAHSEKEEHTSPSLTHSSHSSSDSIESDILSPLEHALTPDLRTEPERLARAEFTITRTNGSFATTGSRISEFEVDFSADDPDDPRNWPLWYRSVVIGWVSFATWAVVLYSTSYTSSMPGMMKEFHETSEPIATLGVTMFMIGLGCGSVILAPLSEIYGRRPVYIGSLLFFSLMVLPCALATGLPEVLIVRFLGALAGAAMISNSPGTVSDITNETHRALAFSIWSIGPMNGPVGSPNFLKHYFLVKLFLNSRLYLIKRADSWQVTGPIIGGFAAEYLGWRWTNWLILIFSAVAWITCACVKETYAPIILQKKAAKKRKETGDDRWWSRYDQKATVSEVLKVNLSRPFVLTFTEPILWLWDGYIAVCIGHFLALHTYPTLLAKVRSLIHPLTNLKTIYAILYLCFIAYPLVYMDLRGWTIGFTGLAFVGIGVGTMLAIVTEPLARRLVHAHKKDPETGRVPPEASVSIVCIASFLCPIGQLWFSWTSVPITIHWIWPILAGIPFGAGNCLVFIYASNYLAGCYGVYSASALAGNTVIRSIIGGTLPLAGPAMYAALSPQWAGTLLGLVQVALIPIPFVFYKWGAKIRARSPLIARLRQDQEKSERRAAAAKRLAERRAGVERGEIKMVEEGELGKLEKEGMSKLAVPVMREKE
ncbi:Major facilitator superfamily multidrug transporter mdrA [Hyphodiscus hymeniophilus]|uniref:Major facilitator superfamily multidrug transporter mdrA n=1 Tax=Hyphodiscus hymeniophilus TaxID=353542 RepID=A0A9P6VGL6_9HELO|nr:Major facilitator superfamily multidrug transporter mdrA [Hyphodiscus hymeniophilus]